MSGKLVLPDIWLFSDLSFQLEAPNATRTPSQWIVTIVCAIRWIPASPRELLRTGVHSLCLSFYFNFFGVTISESSVKNWLNFVSLVQPNLHMYPIQLFASLQFLLYLLFVFVFYPSFCFFLFLFFRVPVQLARFIEKWFKIDIECLFPFWVLCFVWFCFIDFEFAFGFVSMFLFLLLIPCLNYVYIMSFSSFVSNDIY